MSTLLRALALVSVGTLASAQTAAIWNSPTSGTLGSSSFMLSGTPTGFVSTVVYDMSGPDYIGAPLPLGTPSLDYGARENWTATFTPDVPEFLWYGKYTRGANAGTGGALVTYTFDQPFTVLSGFPQGSVQGNTLSVPESSFHDGILKFSVSISSLSCTTNATNGHYQVMTFGQLPIISDPGSAYCFGDGSGASCPCSAFGALGAGCANTGGPGATLAGSGTPTLAADSFQLDIAGVPGDKPGLILRGDSQIAVPAGDGILCTTGATQRSQVQVTSGGSTTYTNFNGAGFGSVAIIGAPTNFQFWYRDPQNTCTGTGFNFTNGWTVTYQP